MFFIRRQQAQVEELAATFCSLSIYVTDLLKARECPLRKFPESVQSFSIMERFGDAGKNFLRTIHFTL